jgi:hypothetical protein
MPDLFDELQKDSSTKIGENVRVLGGDLLDEAGIKNNDQALLSQRLSDQAIDEERTRLLNAINEDLNTFQRFAVGAGRGLTTLARGVGLAEQESDVARQAFGQLAEESIAAQAGEIVGEATPFLAAAPLAGAGLVTQAGARALIPAARTVGQRILGGTLLGAAEGGIISRGRDGDISETITGAGIGGAIGGTVEAVAPIVGRMGRALFQRLGRTPKGPLLTDEGLPTTEFQRALDETGVSFEDLSQDALAVANRESADPTQTARAALFEAQGIMPTRAQITRNAADFQAQQEAAKTSGRVREALEAQESVLTSRFDNAILETGGMANAPSATVIDALIDKATTLDQQISDLYNTARDIAPGEKNIKFTKLTETLKALAPSDRRTGGNIKAIIGDMREKGILDGFKVVGRVDVETAEDLRKLTNELYDPQGEDVFKEGRRAKAAFEQELSRAKVSKFDQRKANIVRDVLENKIDPDRFVEQTVFSKKWRPEDIQQLKDYISTTEAGSNAFNDLRAEVLDTIKARSFIGPEDAQGFRALSRDKLQRSLSSIGDKKLSVLFSKEERKLLNDLLQISKLREPVRGTALGRGPSAQAIGRIEGALRTNPIMRVLLDSISFDTQGRAVLRSTPERLQRIDAPERIAAGVISPIGVALAQEDNQ